MLATAAIFAGFLSTAAPTSGAGALPTVASARHTDPVLILRIHVDGAADTQRVLAQNLDLVEGRGADYYLAVGNTALLHRLRARGFSVSIDSRLPGLASFDDAARPATFDHGYQTVAEQAAHLHAVAAAHPDLAKVVDFGDSWKKTQGAGGSDLLAICVTERKPGDCKLTPKRKKPRFVLMAAIHARELTTAELASQWIDYLVAGYSTDAEVNWLLRTTELWVIPVANPDGRQVVEGGGNQPYLQRKNVDDSAPGSASCANPPTVLNQVGVDLNRNAATPNWGGAGTSANVCDQTFPGTGPASEPEQQALQALLANLFPDTKGVARTAPADPKTRGAFLSLHSYGNLVLFPYGDSVTGGYAPNDAGLRSVAFRMSFSNGSQTGTPDEVLYPVTGSSDDWSYGTLGVASFTFEIGPTTGNCGGFTPPYSCLASTFWPLNVGSFVYAAQVAPAPYQLGLGPTVFTPGVSSPSVSAGTPVTLTARARDDAYGTVGPPNAPGAQKVKGARYAIDAGPTNGNSHALAATDGAFNTVDELLTTSVDTTALTPGRHTLVVQARDASGAWGPVTAVFLTITA